ncbi:SDR family NAD(P)-dependent oxidoreductase [Salirhabdus salicampi]|uniref:SDR family NAD(P)-dependent oxidoreductase n=1 Tax=Salirhabdus salicampi TaxID=476102 RepID=UPI0020C3C4FB|nr:3-oxoacyl-ACP reductase family protein [Salirhabdus salicampi]MCP8615266.1 3-oxoacyl-ACP reductase FabG [Salirhabdus salicampi]
MGKLKNRVAVITGGSRGIGKGIAIAYANEGAHIAFTYRSNKEEADKTAKELESYGVKALPIQADMGEQQQIINMAHQIKEVFGAIHIIVNNAGTIGKEYPLVDMPVEEWDKLMNVDLRGVFLTTKYLLPLMNKDMVGKIINVSSELSLKGRANFTHYTAAKGGINSLTKSLALELAPNILVNTLAPGPVETDMILSDMDEEWIEKEKDVPLKRLGTVEEMAATALLLASDDGNYFCGQTISPNGGAAFL